MDQDLPLSTLTVLSPLDGRYRGKTASLTTYLSEFSLTRVRVEVECSYLAALSKYKIIRELTLDERKFLESLGPTLSIKDVEEIKRIEETLKHDVKAVEVYIREKVSETSLLDVIEFIHFGITSEDINNISYRLMLKRASENVLLPKLIELLNTLLTMAEKNSDLPMLGRTHGQPAVPTTLGKELVVFASRLSIEFQKLKHISFSGKIAGAVGNYNALKISYPETDWQDFANKFVTNLGLSHSPIVTQINTYEDIIEFFQIIERINNILLDFDQDMWRYISDGWFVQVVKKDEVGSSTMPQKVNPIFFENSEGNIGLANALIGFFVQKLPVSRLQRDLSDSTVIRNFGSCLGYSFLAYQNTLVGLSRVKPNEDEIKNALLAAWSILSEAAQTILRRDGIKDPYSLLKSLTRGEKITEHAWGKIVNVLPVSADTKLMLQTLSPQKYIGIAPELTMQEIEKIRKQL
jgi:adenylosuccinate lyase